MVRTRSSSARRSRRPPIGRRPADRPCPATSPRPTHRRRDPRRGAPPRPRSAVTVGPLGHDLGHVAMLQNERRRTCGRQQDIHNSQIGRHLVEAPRPGHRCAGPNSSARPVVRLATTTSAVPLLARLAAMPSPISPAPSTIKRRPFNPSNHSAAKATAAWDTEVMCWEIPVSVRARLPTSAAWRKRALRVVPHVPSSRAVSHAFFTWPWISCSPSTSGIESAGHREEVRHGIGFVVGVQRVALNSSGETWAVSERKSRAFWNAPWNVSAKDVHLDAVCR